MKRVLTEIDTENLDAFNEVRLHGVHLGLVEEMAIVAPSAEGRWTIPSRCLLRISRHAGHAFRRMPVADFTPCRSVISRDAGRSEVLI